MNDTRCLQLAGALLLAVPLQAAEGGPTALTLSWTNNYLTIRGQHLPGREMKIHYLEAYCRPDSQTTDWVTHTVVGHKTDMVSINDDRTRLKLKCVLKDGVVVDHVITARPDEVDFRLVAHNPTGQASEAHWAQPCVRVGPFTSTGDGKKLDSYDYVKKSFLFLDGQLARMPTKDWAMEARYTPGQVWAAPGVPRADVNPRPLNKQTPSNGLIGCFSGDDGMIFATVWEPYQELFQGVGTCLHNDFRLGGLQPGETKKIRGKIYFVTNDVPALLRRYANDFPEHLR